MRDGAKLTALWALSFTIMTGCSSAPPAGPASRPACGNTTQQCQTAMRFMPIPSPAPPPLPTVTAQEFPGTLTIQQGTVDTSIGNQASDFNNPTNLFNGNYLNVWTVDAGDTLTPSLDISGMLFPPYTLPDGSSMTQYTNLHFHGFNVSPLGQSDNIYREVTPGSGPAPYSVRIPEDHPRGSFWLHPHPHGISEPQVLGGLSGLIVVDGLLERYFPAVGPIEAEQYFLLKDYLPNDNNPGQCLAKTINGVGTGMVNDGTETPNAQLGLVSVVAGATYYWHFANIGADQFFDIKLIDAWGKPVTMYVVAIDGSVTAKTDASGSNPVATAIPLTHLFLAPGARMDVLVSLPPGDYNLWSDSYDTGSSGTQGLTGDANCAVQLAWVQSAASAGSPPRTINLAALPPGNAVDRPTRAQLIQAANSAKPPCQQQKITFDEWVDPKNPNNIVFAINKMPYQPGQNVLQIPAAPCTEYWTVQNTTPEAHVFHIHQMDYYVDGGDQAIFRNDEYDQSYLLFQDVVTLPPNGQVNLYMPFTNPVAQGGFVLHCHILGHEDGGMMRDVCFGDCPNLPSSHTGKH